MSQYKARHITENYFTSFRINDCIGNSIKLSVSKESAFDICRAQCGLSEHDEVSGYCGYLLGKISCFAFVFRKKFLYVVIELDHFRGSRIDTIVITESSINFLHPFKVRFFFIHAVRRLSSSHELRMRSRGLLFSVSF